jgi:hypothetical protein
LLPHPHQGSRAWHCQVGDAKRVWTPEDPGKSDVGAHFDHCETFVEKVSYPFAYVKIRESSIREKKGKKQQRSLRVAGWSKREDCGLE